MDKKYYYLAGIVALGAGYWWWTDKKKKDAALAASSSPPLTYPMPGPIPQPGTTPLPGAYPPPVDPAALADLRRTIWGESTAQQAASAYAAPPAARYSAATSVMQMAPRSTYQYPR